MSKVEPDVIALAFLAGALMLMGSACERMEAAPLRMEIAAQFESQPMGVFPEGWIREFDMKRERTIERLNGKMDELRRKLEHRERSSRFRLASHA